MEVDERPSWMIPYKEYLLNGVLLKSRNEARNLLQKIPHFVMQGAPYIEEASQHHCSDV